MDILVSGGSGFLGSHLVDRLLEQDHRDRVIDDLSNGKYTFLEKHWINPNFTFINGDVCDRHLVKEIIAEVDVIYHLAAVLGVKNTVDDPLKVIQGNIEGTKNVLECAFKYYKKIIFASTSEVYGKNTKTPFHENDDRVLGSTSVHRWCYATAKALDEHLCLAYAKKGLPVTILRFFNSYGPRATATDYGGVIPVFIRAAIAGKPLRVFGTGQQTRCFTYVQDTVEAMLRSLDDTANGWVINVGNDQPLRIIDIAKMIKKLSASSSKIVFTSYEKAYGPGYEDMMKRQPDISRMRQLLAFEPKIQIQDGLLRTIHWYKKNIDYK